jgi:uncharacterized OsmC-like protein/predicted alpha/beta-hydrolase family hydrolase
MSSQHVTFPGTSGRAVAARLDLPLDGAPAAWALFAHCLGGSDHAGASFEIARALCRAGIAVMRLHVGAPAEEPTHADGSSPSSADDIAAAAGYLEEHHEAPRILIGHSRAGTMVLRVAERIPSAVAVATLAAPADVEAAARPGDEPEPESLRGVIRALRRPLLILHAPRDAEVDISNAAEIFQAALHPKSFVSLDRADHRLGDAQDARYAGGVIAAWAGRYIDQPVASTVEELVAGRGVATRTGADGYRTEIRARHHSMAADEPAVVGGADTGPTPYELLSAALGTCTSMTLRMYADRKGWPLEEVTVRLRHSRVHALDEEQCEHRSPRVDQIDRTVAMVGPLTDEQRARLLEIADRCPVHRTLEAGVRIQTSEAPLEASP